MLKFVNHSEQQHMHTHRHARVRVRTHSSETCGGAEVIQRAEGGGEPGRGWVVQAAVFLFFFAVWEWAVETQTGD